MQPLGPAAYFAHTATPRTQTYFDRSYFMPRNKVPQRVFRIRRRADGRYESRNEFTNESPLGVDQSLSQAIGTARRGATLASRDGCQVVIEVQQPNGKWKRVDVVEPPAAPPRS